MRVPVENNSQMPIYVAGVMIPPGETRHFEEDQLPPEYRSSASPPVEEQPVDPLVTILAMNVADVVNGLPALSDEELDRLETLEAEGKARKGVIAAVTADRLRRAEAKVNGSQSGAGGEGTPGGQGEGGAS